MTMVYIMVFISKKMAVMLLQVILIGTESIHWLPLSSWLTAKLVYRDMVGHWLIKTCWCYCWWFGRCCCIPVNRISNRAKVLVWYWSRSVLLPAESWRMCTVLWLLRPWLACERSTRTQRACAMRALGLLLADSAPTVGWGRLIGTWVQFFFSETKSCTIDPQMQNQPAWRRLPIGPWRNPGPRAKKRIFGQKTLFGKT